MSLLALRYMNLSTFLVIEDISVESPSEWISLEESAADMSGSLDLWLTRISISTGDPMADSSTNMGSSVSHQGGYKYSASMNQFLQFGIAILHCLASSTPPPTPKHLTFEQTSPRQFSHVYTISPALAHPPLNPLRPSRRVQREANSSRRAYRAKPGPC